jgi:hypothetical protein
LEIQATKIEKHLKVPELKKLLKIQDLEILLKWIEKTWSSLGQPKLSLAGSGAVARSVA